MDLDSGPTLVHVNNNNNDEGSGNGVIDTGGSSESSTTTGSTSNLLNHSHSGTVNMNGDSSPPTPSSHSYNSCNNSPLVHNHSPPNSALSPLPMSPHHRSRKEKLICRSILTSDSVVPVDGAGAEELIDDNSEQPDLLYPPGTSNNCLPINSLSKGNSTSIGTKSPSKPKHSNSTLPKKVKVKPGRKSKVKIPLPASISLSPDRFQVLDSPSPPTTNGTDTIVNHVDDSPSKIKLPPVSPKKVKVVMPSSIWLENNGSSTSSSNGIVSPLPLPLETGSLSVKIPKIRKPRKRKNTGSETTSPEELPRIKRKYVKRKIKIPIEESQQSQIFPPPFPIPLIPPSIPSLFGEFDKMPTPADISHSFSDTDFRGSVSPSHSIPSQASSPRSERKHFSRIDYHQHDSDELENSSTEDDYEGADPDIREAIIPNNTHLLLSPVTLKRMLRTPSPSLQCQVPLAEDEIDEELMLNSNSLFRDLSINRQLKTPSPTGGSQYGGSLSTSSGNHAPSTSGRWRYSRRRFGRMYPPFDTNICEYPDCKDKPLLGVKYCGLHLETCTSPIYGLCQYTEPNSLKPCSLFTVGHDEREFRFCDAHAARIATTRQRMNRIPKLPETYHTVKEELKKNLEGMIEDHVATSIPHSSSTDLNLSGGDEPKEELSTEFNREIEMPPPEHGTTFKQFARARVDYESDEDLHDSDEHDPLGRAGYYSTDEVISIYRSKLEKLRNMYIGEFSALKNAYMDYRVKYLNEKEKFESVSFTYTTNPKYLNIKNPNVPPQYKEHQTVERQKFLKLLRYRHQRGERAVVHKLAKVKHQEKMAEAQEKKKRIPEQESEDINVCDSDSDDEIASPYQFLQTLTKREAQKRQDRLTSTITSESLNINKGSLVSSSLVPCKKTCAHVSSESGSVRCPNRTVPCSDYCQTHILKEPEQTIFSTCDRPLSDGIELCKTPVIHGMDRFGCIIHRMAQVKKYREPEILKLNRRKTIKALPTASAEEELDVLENLIAKETFAMSHFDEAVRYLSSKDFAVLDTDDSEEEESDGGGEEVESPAPDQAEAELLLTEVKQEKDADLF